MIIDANKITFIITEKLKHTRPGAHQKPLIYLAYASDKKLCIVTHLQEYLKRTSALRGENKQLLIVVFIRIEFEIGQNPNESYLDTVRGLYRTRHKNF